MTGPGGEVGDELSRHGSVDLVSLTGDTATGKKIMEAASGTVKRVQLELGGKAPFVVFADADLSAAVEGAVVGGFVNGGQDCTAATRLIVHESIRDPFVTKLVERFADVPDRRPAVPGHRPRPARPPVPPGPGPRVRSRRPRTRGRTSASAAGSRPGPPRRPVRSWTRRSSTKSTPTWRSRRSEVFGPVVDVLEFSTFDEAIWTANSVAYGLAGSVWTSDVRTAVRAANALRFGDVWVNDHLPLGSETPHGGMKQSGFGKDLGVDSLADYTVTKNIYIDLTGQARKSWHYTVYGDPACDRRTPIDRRRDSLGPPRRPLGRRRRPDLRLPAEYRPVLDPSTGSALGEVAVGGTRRRPRGGRGRPNRSAGDVGRDPRPPARRDPPRPRRPGSATTAKRWPGSSRREVGKPIGDARVEADRAGWVFEFAAGRRSVT